MAYYLTIKKTLENKIDDYTIQELKDMSEILKQYQDKPVIEMTLKKARPLKPQFKGEKL